MTDDTNTKVWQNNNGTWSHCNDRRGEFVTKDCALADLRFFVDWEGAK
jgi:hypothetical protein